MENEKNNLVIKTRFSDETNSEIVLILSWLSYEVEPEAKYKIKILKDFNKAFVKLIAKEEELYIQRNFCGTYIKDSFKVEEC